MPAHQRIFIQGVVGHVPDALMLFIRVEVQNPGRSEVAIQNGIERGPGCFRNMEKKQW